MVLPVVGCTIGMTTCAKSRHDSAEAGRSLFGVRMLGVFAQMHSVRKLIAFWLIMLLFCKPPLTGTKHIFGIQAGFV